MGYVFQGQNTDLFDHPALAYTIKGIARTKKHVPKQAFPITVQILEKIKAHVDINTPLGSTYWAMFLLAFFIMARKSNLVADSERGSIPRNNWYEEM